MYYYVKKHRYFILWKHYKSKQDHQNLYILTKCKNVSLVEFETIVFFLNTEANYFNIICKRVISYRIFYTFICIKYKYCVDKL